MHLTSGKIVAATVAVLGLAMGSESFADMGRTVGSWGVSPSGAATYSIPIWVQPGPKDMQPSLALAYSSLGGNGTMGVGWSLSGFSSIDRCPWTGAEDGQDRAVALAASDRFCLDGNKLRITSGPLANYGTAGAVYQTQVANFSRVTSVGAVASPGSGPVSWLVHTKSGLILEYGNSDNSRVIPGGAASGQTVLRWLLNKVSDRDGNSYTITYTTDNTVGRVPLTVSWGNTNAGVFQYQAAFNYSNKSNPKDFVTARQGTVTLTNKLRLDSVTVGYSSSGTGHATKRLYLLHYDPSPTTELSRLTEIKECAATQSNCLKPTTIAYQNGVAGLGSTPTTLASSGGTVVGNFDYNGDGRTDAAYVSGSTWRVAFSTGPAFTVGVDTGMTSTPLAGRFVASRQDGFLVNVSNSWRYVGYNGVSFTATPTGIAVAPSPTIVTDYNGDGLQDLVWTGTTAGVSFIYGRLNTTTGSATVPTFSSTVSTLLSTTAVGLALIPYSSCPTERLCDINGDGIADLAGVRTTTSCGSMGCTATSTQIDVLSNGGDYFLSNPSGTSVAPFVGFRFNDDRCMETFKTNTPQLRIASCGGGASNPIPLPPNPVAAIDWDGDGRTDLVAANGGTLQIYKSTGQEATPFSSVITTSIPSGCAPINFFVSDFDGDGLGELACASNGGVSYYSRNGGGSVGSPGGTNVFATQIPDLASSFTDGYGNSVSPRYVSTLQANYTKGTGTVLPLVDDTEANIVVGRLTVSDGIGTTFDQDYLYKGARRHASLGVSVAPGTSPGGNVDSDNVYGPDGQFSGFEEISVIDNRTNLKTATKYEQLFPLDGLIKQSDNYQTNQSTLITSLVRTNLVHTLDSTLNNRRFFPYTSQNSRVRNEVGGPLNGQPVASSVESFSYTDFKYGNLAGTSLTVTDTDQSTLTLLKNSTFTKSLAFTYAAELTSSTDWCLDLLTRVVATDSSNLNAGADIVRTVAYVQDAANPSKCRISSETVEPDSDAYKSAFNYEYDSFGNVSRKTVVGREPTVSGFADMAPRVTQIDWGTTGQFPVSFTDAAGAKATITPNFDTGNVASTTDPNGLIRSFQFDGFGRITRENAPDETYATYAYEDCSLSGGCMNTLHRLTVTRTAYGKNDSTLSSSTGYFDSLDRALVERQRTLNGGASWDSTYQWSETEFDALGRVTKQYFPCLTASQTTSCKGAFTSFSYDMTNRVLETARPRFAGDAVGQKTIREYAGHTLTVIDALGKKSIQTYDMANQLRQRLDENGYALNFTYDAAGSITGTSDSNSNALLSGVTYNYGLTAMRTRSVDSALGLRTSTFNSLGELVAWSDPNSTAAGKSFAAVYDALSRPTTLTEPGTLAADPDRVSTWVWGNDKNSRNVGKLVSATSNDKGQTFSKGYLYDEFGRLQRHSYSIPGDPVTYSYDYAYDAASGALTTLTYPTSTANFRFAVRYDYRNGLLRQITDPNAGTSFWSANSMNARGQVTAEQYGSSIISLYDYDTVNGRLGSLKTGFASDNTAIQNMSFGYDLVGNVTQRQNNKLTLTEDFFYGSATDKLYRLEHSTLNNGSATVTNLLLTYDASGNILSKTVPGPEQMFDRSITWSSYNFPEKIIANGQTAEFAYGPSHERWKMDFKVGANTETTIYLGASLEKVTAGGVTEFRHYVSGGGRNFATYSRKSTGGTPETRYLFADHQNSVETITNSAGTPLGRESFTAHGERRNSTTWQGPEPTAATLDSYTRQGYTFQTVLGAMGLNHMNGRVQDAVTGRFLSPDPLVNCGTTQGYNRYAYVRNNPLTFVDPSGFEEVLPVIEVVGHPEGPPPDNTASVPTPDNAPSGTDPANTPDEPMEVVEVTAKRKKYSTVEIVSEIPPGKVDLTFGMRGAYARFETDLQSFEDDCANRKADCMKAAEDILINPISKIAGGATGKGGLPGALIGALEAWDESQDRSNPLTSAFNGSLGSGADRGNDGRSTTRTRTRASISGAVGSLADSAVSDATGSVTLGAIANATATEFTDSLIDGRRFNSVKGMKLMKQNILSSVTTKILEILGTVGADKFCSDEDCAYESGPPKQ